MQKHGCAQSDKFNKDSQESWWETDRKFTNSFGTNANTVYANETQIRDVEH